MESNEINIKDLTPEQYKEYNKLQTKIVVFDNIFCIIFVLCITFLAYQLDNWKLMWFYLLPVIAFSAV